MIYMSMENETSLATRPSLLARLADWSQQTAWREFDHDYAPLLRNVARKAGLSDAEADEVVQETLIAVAKKIGEFKHAGRRGSFRAWLYQQARWRVADQFRMSARANSHPDASQSPPSDAGGAGSEEEGGEATAADSFPHGAGGAPAIETDPAFERLWAGEWEEHLRLVALARVKRQVSARQFQLFDLHVLQGMSVRDAAQAAGASVAAVYMAKSRVGRLLKKAASDLARDDL